MPIPFLNQIDLAKLATAVTPDSSAVSLYAKSDDNLYIKRSNGTELQLLTSLDIGGISGTTNYIPKFTAANQLGNSIIYETGGKIGIGKTNPTAKLDVDGNIRAVSIDLVKPALNSVNVQLNTPSVEEMALIHGVMNNKLRFRPPNLQEESSDGTNWVTSSRANANQLADMMIGEGQGTGFTAIPISSVGQQNHYRLTWDYYGTYTYLNSLYIYGVFYNNVLIKIEGLLRSTEEWVTITEGTVTGAPRHIYIPHSTLALHPSNYYSKARITFSVFSSTTTSNVTLNQIEWLGAYPAGRRNVETYDRDKNVTFPAQIIGQSFKSLVPTGTAPFVIASTTRNTNLNADLLDGYHASAFALAGSGVTSFNTRTGAVTLTKADVEGVLTGLITSHTHNFSALADVTITSVATNHILRWNGTAWVNSNLADAGIAAVGHSHSQYVNKTGDFMTGNLSITKSGISPGSDSSYHLASQSDATNAMQAWFEVSSYTNSGTASIRAIRTHNSVITEHILVSAVSGGSSKTLYLGDDTFTAVYLNGESLDTIANVTHVYCKSASGVKRVAISEFTTGGGGSGVTSFNTRTGDVTLLKADVEAVLTGNINTHSHGIYVLKAGDTMTGNLLIHKTNSGSVNAQFGIKADATSNRYHEFRITSISDSDIYETALQMFTPTPTIYSMLIGSVSVDRGAQLSLGGANWDSLSIYAATDVIGNASYVYVSDTSDHVKKVPVSSFGGGSGTVTSVGLSMPNIFSVSNSPVTTSGTLTATLVSQTKNHVLVAPQFANGVPTFRKLTADDMPDLSAMYDNYYCWNAQVNSGTTSQIISASQTPSTGQYKGIRFVEGTGITLSETNVSGILNLKIEADGSSGADNYEAWTLKYSVDGVPTSIPINSINSSGTYRAVRFGGSDINIVPQSEPNNTMGLVFKINITPLEAVLTSNYGLSVANSDYNVLTVSNVPSGTYLAIVDSLGYHSSPSSTCTIIHRLRSSTGTNYLSTAVGNITGVHYRKGNMSGIITLTGTTTLYLTCRSTITGNSIYAACGYGNNATRVTLIKIA